MTSHTHRQPNVQQTQLLHFRYADGARMLTVGGLLTTAGDHDAVGTVDLDGLFFAKTGSEPYDIRIPNITNREILHLSSQMPGDPETVHHHGIPPKERREFAEAYRYFPAYLAVDLSRARSPDATYRQRGPQSAVTRRLRSASSLHDG